MDWLTVDGVDWIAVSVAFFATFVLGWIWYSQVAFFPVWTRLGRISDEDMKRANMGIAFGGMVVATLLGVVTLGILMAQLPVTGAASGAVLGGVLGFVFRGGAHAVHNGFAARHPGVTLIDGLHDTVGLAVAGAILGAM
jgi:hypothetical protein